MNHSRLQRMASRLDLKSHQTIVVNQQGRNEPCKCGSGKKAKKCCGTEKEILGIFQNPLLEPKKVKAPEPEKETTKTLDELLHD